MKKRILALALSLCMMLSMMPTAYAGEGFLTLDGQQPEVSQHQKQPQQQEGFLTLDGQLPESDEPSRQPEEGVLTLDQPDLEVQEPTTPIISEESEQNEGVLFVQCDFCGYLDGNHADDCATQQPEEEIIVVKPAAERKAAIVYSFTYQDTFDALMEADTLSVFESILDELTASQLEEFYDLLSSDELDALDEQEDELAQAAVIDFEKETSTKKTVTVERRASLFGAAQREMLRQLGYELIVDMFGWIVDAIDLPQNDYTVMEAVSPASSADYQWQILADDDLWVDIYNETDSLIRVSYAMVANLLDRYDAVQVRCEITGEDGVTYTDPVEVCVDYTSDDVIIDAEEEPVVEDLIVEEGVVEDVVIEEPIVEEPIVEEPIVEEPIIEEPIVEEPIVEEPIVEEPIIEEPIVEEPIVEEPIVEEPIVEEPIVEEPIVEEPIVEEPVVEEPVAQTFSVTRLGGTYAQPFTVSLLNTDGEAAPAQESQEEEGSTETPSTYSIIINYVFADGKQAANPWTAKVAADSSYAQTVKSPDVLGYEPDKATVDVDVTNISSDTVYKVTYLPAEVKYTVKHYQQNVNDDDYTLVSEVEKEGYTESAVGAELAKAYEGFYALLYDTTTKIAADSSTVVEIYYDRYYYLMNFDLDGGYGVEPIYARYGATVSTGTPTKAGYTFTGWKAEDGTAYTAENFPYDTMPAQNTEFTAQWTPGDTTYDVVFWYENADDNKYSQAGVLLDQPAAAGSKVNGASHKDYAFTGRDNAHFTYSHADENVVVKGDGSTVVNVYFSRNTYTLTFRATGLCALEQHSHTDACYGLSCTIPVHTHSDDCQFTCTHTQHELSCWGLDTDDEVNKPDQITEQNPVSGTVYTYRSYGSTRYYLYLNGKWYCHHYYGSNIDYYSISLSNCSHPEHTSACYSCGKIAHEHSSVGGTCYGLICDKTAHTHTASCTNANSTNTVKVITAKYEASISSHFPITNGETSYSGYQWTDSEKVVFNYALQTLDKMPGSNVTFSGSERGTDCVIYYFVQTVTGESLDGVTTRTFNGKTYKLLKSVEHSFNYITYEEEYHTIDGYSRSRNNADPAFGTYQNNQNSAKLGNSGNGYDHVNYLYYDRLSYNLTFSNSGSTVSGKGGSVQFEAPLKNYNFTPEYPANLEPDAYVFEGWYESPFFGDTKVDFATAKMPANDLTLYARWVPKNHNVNIYLTDDMEQQIGETQIVAHGNTAKAPETPKNGEYIFVGWFYMEEETEKAFDFSMPVTKDLELYAKWSSNTLMEYTIHYELADGTRIAEDTTGSALAGTTKTFEAKAGDELNDGYQKGYFPTTNSHSLTIDIEDPTKNTFTFIYVPKEELPYKVMYLEYDGDYIYDGTENELKTKKEAKTRDAVITETFEPITGYRPDAYQKRLVLSADEKQNVIIFWYVVDNEHAPVQIIHYIQNAEGDDYSIYQESTDLNGVIGQPYNTNVLTIKGFEYDNATANGTAVAAADGKVTGTVTAEGLILELYYNRELHPYEFKFLEQGTDKVLADSVTGNDRYQAQVTQNAKPISGYKLVSDESQAIIIQIEDGNTAVKNVRTFYYVEDEATINYVVVGPEGCGTVTPASETVKVITGTATGSTATASDNVYKFVGWYDNEACNGTALSTDAKYVPTKEESAVWTNTTYYAKFEYNLTSLTIKKEAQKGTVIDSDQTFVFKIVGSDGFKTSVIIKGEGSVTITGLTVGVEYTVTEDTSWSWRYTPDKTSKEITLTANASANEVSFANKLTNNKWFTFIEKITNIFDTPKQ